MLVLGSSELQSKDKGKSANICVPAAELHPAILGKLHGQFCHETAFNQPQLLLIILAVLL